MKTLSLALLIVVGLLLPPSIPQVRAEEPVTPAHTADDTFWDAFFAERMAAHHVPGAVFVIVQDGDIVLAKGYGVADVEQQRPVRPDTTTFHLGSVAKLMTATAVMQLVEQDQLNLHTDVNRYLHDVRLADTYPQPITLFHLLTHTGGLEQHGIGTGARNEAEFVSLPSYLQERPPQRLMPPGQVIIYSSVGIAVAGQVVEDVTGMPFADYVRRHIFAPLHMSHSTFVAPPEHSVTRASGYRYHNGGYIPYTEPYYSTIAPGGDVVSTGMDMANFLIAHLERGRFGDVQLLQPETVRFMQSQQVTHHSGMRGRAIGFSEWRANGQRAIFHDGSAPGFLSRIFLVPEHRMGFFVAYNNGDAFGFKRDITSVLLDAYFPEPAGEPRPSALKTTVSAPLPDVAGYYRAYEFSRSGLGKLSTLFNQIPVTVRDEQHLHIGAATYTRVAPTLFQSSDGARLATFREEKGGVTYLLLGTAAFEKVAWYETQPVQFGLLGVFGLTFLAAVTVPFFAGGTTDAGRLVRWYAGLIGGLNLVFLVSLSLSLVAVLRDPWSLVYGLTPTLQSILILPLVSSVLTLGFVVLVFRYKRYTSQSLIDRLYYTWVTIAAIGFILFMHYWNLLCWPA